MTKPELKACLFCSDKHCRFLKVAKGLDEMYKQVGEQPMPSEKTYDRDQAAVRMTKEPGRVMHCDPYNGEFSYGQGTLQERDGDFWSPGAILPVGTYTDAPDPSKPEPAKQVCTCGAELVLQNRDTGEAQKRCHQCGRPCNATPEEPKEPGFEVCLIQANGCFHRPSWPRSFNSRHWRSADEERGFAGYDWELPDGSIEEGLNLKVIWWTEEYKTWAANRAAPDYIPLIRPKAVRFLKGGEG